MPPRKVPHQACKLSPNFLPVLRLQSSDAVAVRKYERYQMIDEARQLWAELCKARPYSYAAWYGRADFETCVSSIGSISAC